MKKQIVLRVLSFISLIVSLSMIFPLIWAAVDGSPDLIAFILALGSGLLISGVLFLLSRVRRKDYEKLGLREAFAVVTFSWLIASTVGALPYVLSDFIPSYTDAFFESVSGFTTTGATILADIEAVPRALLFWRALTHWLGGMGIIVLGLAVMPFLGVGGMELYKAEVPGPTPEKITPRIQQTAVFLWGIYVALTLIQTVLLMSGGMDFFDAITHSFSSMATGGFSPKNASIGHYRSSYIEWVTAFFMFISSMNFSLHYLVLTGHFRKALRDEELRGYVKMVLLSALLIACFLVLDGFGDFFSSLWQALYHVLSVVTSTGFFTTDYAQWPPVTQFILLLLTAVGACAGSTAGGIKVVRVLIMGRQIRAEVTSLLHPSAVIQTRFNKKVISRKALSSITAFFMLYIGVTVCCTLVVTAFDHPKLDILTSLSAVLASLSNVGPGLGAVGPVENFSWLPAGVKWICSLCMLAGRLELFAMALLFLPSAWNR
ncbi:MAG: TrkH family potassium uptake protein [Fretibacterium sp.]|nr:TrkH family potassium uptake protein [Fretibacterium sp.]